MLTTPALNKKNKKKCQDGWNQYSHRRPTFSLPPRTHPFSLPPPSLSPFSSTILSDSQLIRTPLPFLN
ncbi:hypothetical protein ACN38_g3702 [Penicillium nordicum]|uniref:Uncharacterized protein n=1 Tax=Penicillium nordicum TaxID=229535 RepID=A0A0N0RZC5_9EURO|nr:hypothetical protein ACN38_g3702 [Penicillium nordicum]